MRIDILQEQLTTTTHHINLKLSDAELEKFKKLLNSPVVIARPYYGGKNDVVIEDESHEIQEFRLNILDRIT